MKTLALDELRRHAIARSLFKPTTLPKAVQRLGFVQADPIRAPARAQDLTLRHRVQGYRAGDLERRYGRLGLEEDFFINYGFLPAAAHALMHPRHPRTAGTPWTTARWAQAEAVLDPTPHDPWPRHFQHFGASIAVTCQMYQKTGGLPQKPYLEDEAFYKALLRTDAKVRQSPHVKVITSTRQDGRVAIGFSEQLRYWSVMVRLNKCQVAEPAEAVILRLRNRQCLRTYWNAQTQPDPDALLPIAADLLLDPAWLHRMTQKCTYFGQLWEQVEKKMATSDWTKKHRSVSITTAIQSLRAFLRE